MAFKKKTVALAVHQALTFYSAWNSLQEHLAAEAKLHAIQTQNTLNDINAEMERCQAALVSPVGDVSWKELHGKN